MDRTTMEAETMEQAAEMFYEENPGACILNLWRNDADGTWTVEYEEEA